MWKDARQRYLFVPLYCYLRSLVLRFWSTVEVALMLTIDGGPFWCVLLANSPPDIVLENLTAVPVSLSSVLLEWKVVPSDGHHCITSYNIQITGPNGTQWEEQIPGGNNSFHFTGIQLMHLQNYTCCITANLDHSAIQQTITVELKGELLHNVQVSQWQQGSENKDNRPKWSLIWIKFS